MASGGSDGTPQFTSSHYEIPSWQVPWNKPWYQCVEGKGFRRQTKYNSRGHEVNCNCTRCEEDLETAFTPQAVNDSADILNVVKRTDLEESANEEEECQEEPKKNTVFPSGKVLLFSELPEVKPKKTESGVIRQQQTESASRCPSGVHAANPSTFVPSSETVIDSVGSLNAIAAISDRTKDIQARVEQFSSDTSIEEYVILRGLLVACLAQLNRIDSTDVRWLEMAKNMCLDAIRGLLTKLEEKLKDRGDL